MSLTLEFSFKSKYFVPRRERKNLIHDANFQGVSLPTALPLAISAMSTFFAAAQQHHTRPDESIHDAMP
jgi:hypothetical protein